MGTATTAPEFTGITGRPVLADACRERGEYVRDLAHRAGLDHGHTFVPTTLAMRIGYDSHAAAEFPKVMLADACDVERMFPDDAAHVWHAVAGATILGRLCCGAPAHHRDALVEYAAAIRAIYG